MTDMEELVAFLRAQLDVEEAKGEAEAFPPPGHPDFEREARGAERLAEIEFHRALLELHHHDDGHECVAEARASLMGFYLDEPCPTLRLLARRYSDRPGYRAEWRP